MPAIIHETVRDLALRVPGATRVFERAGIDYCCGGGQTLEAACAAAGVDGQELIGKLNELELSSPVTELDQMLKEATLEQLIEHIVSKHHVFTADELARLDQLLAKVQSRHGENHPELAKVGHAFCQLRDDLMPHMMKEERILFPYITDMERAHSAGRSIPMPPFGTVSNPIRMMMHEHDVDGALLRDIREASGGFTLPADACMSFRALYEGLEELERDLHQHIHLENNVLFPRAMDMESQG